MLLAVAVNVSLKLPLERDEFRIKFSVDQSGTGIYFIKYTIEEIYHSNKLYEQKLPLLFHFIEF